MPDLIHHASSDKRCKVCRMLHKLCICEHIPNIKIGTRISILMHSLEEHKITNTAHLLKLAIPSTQINIFGRLGVSDELIIPPEVTPLVLFPEQSAPILTEEFCFNLKSPLMLIIPDGTWTQARKLIHRRSNLYGVRRVRINRSEPSQYRVRRNQLDGGLCTLEAIAEALGVIEGPKIKDLLINFLNIMVKQVLITRSNRSA